MWCPGPRSTRARPSGSATTRPWPAPTRWRTPLETRSPASPISRLPTFHHRRHRARRPDRPHGNGQRDQHDQPRLDRAVQRRRLRHQRLQDRGFVRWRLELDRPRGRHRRHQHHLRGPLSRRHYPPLPRLGDQLGRHRRRLQRRHPHRARRPDCLTATASGTSTIDLSWTAPADDGGSAISGYRIEVSSDGGSSWISLVVDTDDTNTTYEDRVPAGSTRHYRVSAINSVGTGAASNVDDATTDDAATTVPGAPTGLTATASGTSTINLSWTAPADDGGASISGYRIEVSPNGTSSWTNREANTGSTSTSYAHTGFPPAPPATTASRRSTRSAPAPPPTSTTPPPTTPPPCPRPDRPHGYGQRDQHDQPLLDRAGRRRRRLHQRLQDRGFAQCTSNWTNREANTGSTSTSYSHTGLSAGTTRHYRVSAINSVGTGAASNVDDATTANDTNKGPLVLTVEAVEDEVTEGEPVRYRIIMSRRTSGAVVQSSFSYKGDFVRNPNSSVVTGVQFSWRQAVLGEGVRDAGRRDRREERQFHGQDREAGRGSLRRR